ncbi:glycosyltransferase family 92 protein At1g27200-like [Carex rostrata]
MVKLKSFFLIILFVLSLKILYHFSSFIGVVNPALNRSVQPVDHLHIISSDHTDAILLPDWEVFVLLPPHSSSAYARSKMMCQFQNGATSAAFFGGVVPSSGRITFNCLLPKSVRRTRPFLSPRIISTSISRNSLSKGSEKLEFDSDSAPEMLRWIQLVYDAVTTPLDVIIFAKGLNRRSGTNLPASDVECVYLSVANGHAATYGAISSAQEVFRCPHPSSMDLNFFNSSSLVKISLAVGANKTPIPSIATYSLPRAPVHDTKMINQSLICACTMVFNVAKFLREWVLYHASIGVVKFILYDNGSEDELGTTVSQLLHEGYDVATYYWPWPKTQEAGFSHCAAVNEQSCQWMAFIDVDEFVFAPAWADSDQPNPTMLASLVQHVRSEVGQIIIRCHDFAPSGLRAHPKNGITQGYICRRKSVQRHKSILRLRAVDRSLVNSVHHFKLKDGFKTKNLASVRINHYKYQVWEEFRMKFRRRVSAYVVDWKDQLNPGSQDRTPGLGFEPVEPDGWAHKFCEENDTLLRDVTRRWFMTKETDGRFKLKWERV